MCLCFLKSLLYTKLRTNEESTTSQITEKFFFVYFKGSGFTMFYSHNLSTFRHSIPLSGPITAICTTPFSITAQHALDTTNYHNIYNSRLIYIYVPRHTLQSIGFYQVYGCGQVTLNVDGRASICNFHCSSIFLSNVLLVTATMQSWRFNMSQECFSTWCLLRSGENAT